MTLHLRIMFAAALVASLAACKSTATEIIVLVDSDLPNLHHIDAETYAGDASILNQATIFSSNGETTLPLSFGVVPIGNDPNRRVALRVLAYQEGEPLPVVYQDARTGFIEDQTLQLPIFLSALCIDVACSDDETCSKGRCVPVDFGVPALPPFETEDVGAWHMVRDGEGDGEGDRPTTVASLDVGPGGRIHVGAVDVSFTEPASRGFALELRQHDGRVIATRSSQREGTGYQVSSVREGADGRVYVAGGFSVARPFGEPVAPNMAHDNFVAAFEPDGQLLWSTSFGGPDEGTSLFNVDVVTDMELYRDALYVSGQVAFVDSMNHTQMHAVIQKLDVLDGRLHPPVFLEASTYPIIDDFVIDGGGNLYLVGQFIGEGTLRLPPSAASGSGDAFITKLRPDLTLDWTHRIGGPVGGAAYIGADSLHEIAISGAGTLTAVGSFAGVLSYDDVETSLSTLESDGDVDPDTDGLVLEIDQAGNIVHAYQLGSPDANDFVTAIAIERSGVAFLGAQVSGPMRIGARDITPRGVSDSVVAKMVLATGEITWSRVVSSETENSPEAGAEEGIDALAIDALGGLLIGGHFNGRTTLEGEGVVEARDAQDLFVWRLPP